MNVREKESIYGYQLRDKLPHVTEGDIKRIENIAAEILKQKYPSLNEDTRLRNCTEEELNC